MMTNREALSISMASDCISLAEDRLDLVINDSFNLATVGKLETLSFELRRIRHELDQIESELEDNG